MFSPPRTIMSFERPTIEIVPSSCITAMSLKIASIGFGCLSRLTLTPILYHRLKKVLLALVMWTDWLWRLSYIIDGKYYHIPRRLAPFLIMLKQMRSEHFCCVRWSDESTDRNRNKSSQEQCFNGGIRFMLNQDCVPSYSLFSMSTTAKKQDFPWLFCHFAMYLRLTADVLDLIGYVIFLCWLIKSMAKFIWK